MATFPAKTNYAAGNVLTAAQMVDIGEQINALNGCVGKNKIINGDFSIWQRGTSLTLTANNGFLADRWKSDSGSGGVLALSRQTFTPGQTDVPGAVYYYQAAYTTSGTGTVVLEQRIEDVNTLAGQTATFSFYAKVTSGTKSITPRFVQDFGSGGSATVVTSLTAQTLTTTWQRFVVTGTIPSISGKTVGTNSYLRIDFDSGTSGVTTFQFANIQVEAGNVATAFQTATGTLAGEFQSCQRYFQIFAANDVYGSSYNTADAYFEGRLPVVMRTGTQTVTLPATGSLDGYWVTGGKTSATAPVAWKTTNAAVSFVSRGYTGLTANDFMAWTGGNITISAEL